MSERPKLNRKYKPVVTPEQRKERSEHVKKYKEKLKKEKEKEKPKP